MTARALHMRRDRRDGEGLDMRFSLCGFMAVDLTESHVEVTCRLCRAKLADVRGLEVAVDVLGVEVPVVPGERELDASKRRIVERSIAGDDGDETGRARFRSWASLHERHARVYDDGSPVRSSSDPGRFGARAQSSGGAVRMPSGRDDMIEVDMALDHATSAAITIGPHVLSGEMQRAIYLARCEGRPIASKIAKDRKGVIVTRAELSTEQVAERLGEGWTAHHVAMVVRAVRAKAGPRLVAKGILPARAAEEREATRSEGEEMAKVPGYDLEGVKEISAHLELAETTVKRLMARQGRPLPTKKYLSFILAKKSELDAWREAELADPIYTRQIESNEAQTSLGLVEK